jgi:cellulose synthase/poly-beta-1,6-N-acetylglucosamine synthase-like glycosyltransferase
LLVLTILYIACSLWLSIYGFNAYWLIWLYLRHRRSSPPPPPLSDAPTVTVQLPLYNERHVVCRAIDALAALDWPRDRLQIQVLDDSTDETVALARERVAYYQRRGIDIVHRHRDDRAGFKAGALNAALAEARGEYVAIFDADFAPCADFVQRTVPYLVADPGLAFVQARWGHLNDGYSLLTQAQSIALDGHFVIEHLARERAGLLSTFNGTGGVWRKGSIEDSGGWDPEQLTEDVDLAYRAQLRGWHGMTVAHIAAPAELPAQLLAFKQQQSRWAKGNMQCLLKLGGPLVRASISWSARLQGLIHLSNYLAHPLMLVVLLATLPLIWYGKLDSWPIGVLSLGTLGPPLLYALSQRELYPRWGERLHGLPTLICLGLGLALSSTVAIAEVLLGKPGSFQRTPKFQLSGRVGSWKASPYALSAGRLVWGEIALTLYALLTVLAAIARGHASAVPFLALYAIAFGYMSVMSLVQSAAPRAGQGERSRRYDPSSPAGRSSAG